MKKFVLLIGILFLAPSVAQAKKYTTSINSSSVSLYTKHVIIAKAWSKLPKANWWKKAPAKARWTGIRWAAYRARVVFSKECRDACGINVLEWDSKYIWWGIKWWYKQQKKKVKKPCPPTPKCQPGTCCGSKCKVKVTVQNKITIVNKPAVKKETPPEETEPESSYFERGSRFLISGFFLEQGLHGCSLSRGGGAIADLRLLKYWDTAVGRVELKLGGVSSRFSTGKGFNAFAGTLNLLAGEQYGSELRFQVLGGLSADFIYANGKFRDDSVKLLDGALKAMLMGRMDTSLISAEARVTLGIGGQDYDRKYTLLRMEGMIQGELHLFDWMDLVIAGGVRYDQLFTRNSSTPSVLLFGRGYLQANVWRGLLVAVGIEAGKYYKHWDVSYIMPYIGVGYEL